MKNYAAPAWRHSLAARSVLALGLIAVLSSCAHRQLSATAGASNATTRALRAKIDLETSIGLFSSRDRSDSSMVI